MSWRGICRRTWTDECLLDEGERVKRRHGNVPIGTEVHLVVAVVGVGKRLCPNGFNAFDRPLAVVEHRVDGIKVDDRRGLKHRSAHDEDRPLVECVTELRVRKLGRIGEDHCRRLLRRAQWVVETLEAGAEIVVPRTHEHDRHAKRGLLKEDRRRRSE